MKTLDAIDIIARIILVITAIAVVYLSLKFIFGNSPDLNQINSMFITMIITALFTLTITFMKTLSHINREVGEIKIGMKHSFDKVKEDIDLIKKKLKI